MIGVKSKRLIFIFLPAILASFAVFFLANLLQTAGAAVTNNGDNLVIVADTTASMQPELNALAAAWPGSVIPNDGRDRLFHLLQYRDAVQYKGSTNEIGQIQSWLNELTAAGGGECEDAMLQAIAAAARGVPDSRLLLLSDSAPQGSQSNLAFIANKLIERNINIYPIISGWCGNAALSQNSMVTLARMTGGIPRILQPTEVHTGALDLFNLTALSDMLVVQESNLNGIEDLELPLDVTLELFDVGVTTSWTG